MKQVLFLAAIYALIFHQSNKNTKSRISFNSKKALNKVSHNGNRFNPALQNVNGPFVLNDNTNNTFATFDSYQTVLYKKQ